MGQRGHPWPPPPLPAPLPSSAAPPAPRCPALPLGSMGRGRPGPAPPPQGQPEPSIGQKRQSRERGAAGGCRHSMSWGGGGIRGAGSPWGCSPAVPGEQLYVLCPPEDTKWGNGAAEGKGWGGGAGVDAAVTGIGGWGGVESFQPGGMREQHPSRAVSRARLWGAPPPGLGPVPLLSTKHRSSNVLYISSTPCAKIITSPGSSTMSSPMCWFSQAITTTACLPGMRLAT